MFAYYQQSERRNLRICRLIPVLPTMPKNIPTKSMYRKILANFYSEAVFCGFSPYLYQNYQRRYDEYQYHQGYKHRSADRIPMENAALGMVAALAPSIWIYAPLTTYMVL